MAGQTQVVGGRQSRRPAADHADRRAGGRRDRAVGLMPDGAAAEALHPEALADKALQRADARSGASSSPRRHAVSHGAAHTRPQIDGNGLGCRAIR